MSVAGSKVKLSSAIRDLRIRWDQTREGWKDAASESIEQDYIAPFEREVRTAIKALETMSEVMIAIRKDCSEDRP